MFPNACLRRESKPQRSCCIADRTPDTQVAVAAAKSKKKGQQKSSKPRKKAAPDPNACPCGSNKPYEGCCGIIHAEGAALAEVSAKDLMRYYRCCMR